MAQITEAIRPYWVPGLNEVAGRVDEGFTLWVIKQKFQVYDPPVGKRYTLTVADRDSVLRALAHDCSRLGSAAFESIALQSRHPEHPKAVSWLLIGCYYAAFFSAHTILRMLGHSVSHLESSHVHAIKQVSTIYGIPLELATGYHRCSVGSTLDISCQELGGKSGSHESVWLVFYGMLDEMIRLVVRAGLPLSLMVGGKLIELRKVLSAGGCNGGNWLSYMRNLVNYRQEKGAWFPYRGQKRGIADKLFQVRQMWLSDPMSIDVSSGTEFEIFMGASVFLVAWCREMLVDMASRCPGGRSFLEFGPLHFLRAKHVA